MLSDPERLSRVGHLDAETSGVYFRSARPLPTDDAEFVRSFRRPLRREEAAQSEVEIEDPLGSAAPKIDIQALKLSTSPAPPGTNTEVATEDELGDIIFPSLPGAGAPASRLRRPGASSSSASKPRTLRSLPLGTAKQARLKDDLSDLVKPGAPPSAAAALRQRTLGTVEREPREPREPDAPENPWQDWEDLRGFSPAFDPKNRPFGHKDLQRPSLSTSEVQEHRNAAMAAQQMLYKSLKQKNQQKFPSGARPKDSADRAPWDRMGGAVGRTICFLLEFVARMVVLRGSYLVSFIGWVDLISLLAFIETCTPTRHDEGLHPDYQIKVWSEVWLDLVLPCRLMRLMMLESWTPAIQSLCDVVWIRGAALRRACYALLSVWYMFTVCLYDSGGEVGERFENVLVGLPHGLIHLTGDYPCTDYRTISMPFHLVFLILGMCCTGTFTGIFAGGFVEYLGAQRELERQQAKDERLRVMAMAVSLLQRRFRLRRQRALPQMETPHYSKLSMKKAARRCLATSLGRVFMTLAQAALVVNVLNTMLESIPEVEAIGPEARFALTLVEIITGTIFCIEFILHLVAKPIGLFTTPMRIVDFVCLFPTILRSLGAIRFQCQSVAKQDSSPGLEAFIECVAACRIVRVLDWPQIRREVLAVKQTLKAALPSLAMPAVISLQLWVLTAGIFVWLENFYAVDGEPSDKDQMESIPDALYWCSIYLLGEWANDEFTDGAGSRLCIFYCLCGVALFSIPVGIMVEAGRATLEKVADERKELAELKAAAVKRPKEAKAM
eukprot:s430_g1.t2